MSTKGVIINRGKIGAGVNSNADSISGLLANGIAVAADAENGIIGIAVGETVKLTGTDDAKAYGIDAAYDSANNIRVYRHIEEFYRMAGEGTVLYLMLYTGTPSDAFGATFGKKMIADANGDIKQLAVAYSPASDYVATFVDGLEDNVRDAIPEAQLFYEWTFETFRPCQIVLEGRGFNAASATAALDLRNIVISGNVMQYTKVTLCIAQDYDYADTQNAVGKKMADVGTLLGCVALQAVNRNVGEVETMNLTNTTKSKWLKAALSNHVSITDFESHLEGLDAKGYVFVLKYTGYAGHFWNDDHTCTPVVVDENGNMNENSISLGRTHDKACRVLRTSLLPKVKSTQPVDGATGKMPQAIITYFEEIGNTAFDTKMKGEVSFSRTIIDPNSNLLVAPKQLNCSFEIVPTGQVGVIVGTINIKTSA